MPGPSPVVRHRMVRRGVGPSLRLAGQVRGLLDQGHEFRRTNSGAGTGVANTATTNGPSHTLSRPDSSVAVEV